MHTGRALQSTCSSSDERIKVLEMHNVSLSQDLEQSKAEMLSAREMQLQVGQERAAGAEREAEYKARIASLDAQLRAAQHQRSARCLSVGHDCSLQLTCRDAGVRAEGAWGGDDVMMRACRWG